MTEGFFKLTCQDSVLNGKDVACELLSALYLLVYAAVPETILDQQGSGLLCDRSQAKCIHPETHVQRDRRTHAQTNKQQPNKQMTTSTQTRAHTETARHKDTETQVLPESSQWIHSSCSYSVLKSMRFSATLLDKPQGKLQPLKPLNNFQRFAFVRGPSGLKAPWSAKLFIRGMSYYKFCHLAEFSSQDDRQRLEVVKDLNLIITYYNYL